MSAISAILALTALAAAGSAQAGTGRLDLTAPTKGDVAALNAAVFAPDGQPHDPPKQGVARTSLDRRFDRQGANGAVGFLCGRPNSLDERAASQPLGSDPQGRFLGARLSFVFR